MIYVNFPNQFKPVNLSMFPKNFSSNFFLNPDKILTPLN